jgi:hypothetical protein
VRWSKHAVGVEEPRIVPTVLSGKLEESDHIGYSILEENNVKINFRRYSLLKCEMMN